MYLTEPFNLKKGNVVIKNRLLKSAMSEQLSDVRHNPTEELIYLYSKWAKGGVGVNITGNVMVDRKYLGEPKNIVLDDKSDLSMFSKWAQVGSEKNVQLWMQLNHPGKQIPNYLNKKPIAPSAIPLCEGLEKVFNLPREMTHQEILDTIESFITAAKLAKKAGFNGVQIHSAHGYLINQFLSPSHNQRNDEWGGSIENRSRFLLDICRGVRRELGDSFIISVKLNSADFMKGGFNEEDSLTVIKALELEGVDILEISGGTYESPRVFGQGVGGKVSTLKKSTVDREAYFLDFAKKARAATNMPLVVTGGFRTTKGMNTALESGDLDLVGLGRPMTLDADLPNKAMKDESFDASFEDPGTGIHMINRMTGISIMWFEEQILRIAQDKSPDPNLSAWKVVFKTVFKSGRHMFKARRA
jgi:2,4-dienoyl-CoA reductase-like NADH-dependent reductase (Old Yellow Enzyme family)